MVLNSTTPRRLYLMQLGTSTIPATPQLTAGSAGCYLVQMGDGKNILIDSGLPADYAPPPGENEKSGTYSCILLLHVRNSWPGTIHEKPGSMSF